MNLISYLKSYVHMNLKWMWVSQTLQTHQPCQCSPTLEEVSLGHGQFSVIGAMDTSPGAGDISNGRGFIYYICLFYV